MAEGAIDLFIAFKNLAMKMDWKEDCIIFTDRSGDMIRIIEAIARAERDSYVVTGRKMGLITL